VPTDRDVEALELRLAHGTEHVSCNWPNRESHDSCTEHREGNALEAQVPDEP